jgi:tRNA 5-methylaminomethyl-2-thiouridine biosynthesis bifunctional protein
MLNCHADIEWVGGQPFSRRYGDIYFSREGGLAEKRHVFLHGNNLPERFTFLAPGQAFTIGETGFGMGLNFLCARQLFEETAQPGSSLDYFGVEKYPLDGRELEQALAPWPELRQYADELMQRWRRRVPGWNRWSFANGRIRLTLVIDDALTALPETSTYVDAWFLDGFAPLRNPEIWAQPVCESIVSASRPGATFSTYTCTGWVRRGLEKAGFRVDKAPGFGRKREMLRGYLAGSAFPSPPPAAAIVIGGGLAGCSVACALAARGIRVSLIEQAPRLAAAASGNSLGILHARLGAGMNPLQRFILASYGHALALLDEKLPVDGMVRAECGELQLAFSGDEARRIDKLAILDWPPHILQSINSAEASSLAGLELAYGGLWFPAGGWVAPARMCAALAADPGIEHWLGYSADSLTRENGTHAGWRVAGRDGNGQHWEQVAPIVAVCTSYQIKNFTPLAGLPLTPVRGQITALPVTQLSKNLRTIVSASAYLSPPVGGSHVAGATHGFNDVSTELRPSDHLENLSRLSEISSALVEAWNNASLNLARLGGRASVRASVPGAIPLAGEFLPGLFTSLGHGTRGLLTTSLSGELIAAAACGQLPPLPAALLKALNPAARLARKRNQPEFVQISMEKQGKGE